jgi:ribosomal protein S18 acetylase RimI-like enzyme
VDCSSGGDILPVRQRFSFQRAVVKDAAALAALHTAVAKHLTDSHGEGPWSSHTTEKGVLFAMRNSHVWVAREGREIVATLRLASKKPWAIDTSYFTKCAKSLYLLGMAVAPARQRQGIDRKCLEEANQIAATLQVDAIRLDAYNADAGAGRFYESCGYAERGRVIYRNTPLIYYELLLTKKPKPACDARR